MHNLIGDRCKYVKIVNYKLMFRNKQCKHALPFSLRQLNYFQIIIAV